MREERDNSDKRLFIAIDIPENTKKSIYSFTSDLFGNDSGIKIVPASNVHVTLKFLGNINTGKIGKIESAVKISADSLKSFRYRITGRVNAFPNLRSARVIYLEIGDGRLQISKIYNILENNLSKIKIRKEGRKFTPHITIGRIRGKKDIEKPVSGQLECPADWMDCLDITLFESKLKPYGAEYSIISKFNLK